MIRYKEVLISDLIC